MKLAKEPKDVDLIIKSEPWTEKDLADFRDLMRKIKRENTHEKDSGAMKAAKTKPTRKTA